MRKVINLKKIPLWTRREQQEKSMKSEENHPITVHCDSGCRGCRGGRLQEGKQTLSQMQNALGKDSGNISDQHGEARRGGTGRRKLRLLCKISVRDFKIHFKKRKKGEAM